MMRVVLLLMLLALPAELFAEARIYLLPRVIRSETITLGSIARIESSLDAAQALRNLVIPEELYRDGIIDIREINSFIKANHHGIFFVYGTGVSVNGQPGLSDDNNAVIVTRGKRVRLVVIRRGVRVEVPGEVMKDGKIGDLVPVKIGNSNALRQPAQRIVQGIVASEKEVEVVL